MLVCALSLAGCGDRPAAGADTGARDGARADTGVSGDAPRERGASDARPHDAGPPPQPPLSAKGDELLRACVMIGSCIPDDGANVCLRGYLGKGELAEAAAACVAKASGCAGVKSCIGIHSQVGCPAGAKRSCSGDSLVICDGQLASYLDCKKLYGVGCVTPASGDPRCGTAAACTAPSCKNDLIVSCDGGQESYSDNPPCGLLGLGCQGGKCAGADGACAVSSCKGDVAALCVGGGLRNIDCGALGGGFACSQGGNVHCERATECDPASSKHKETCDGDQLVVCYGGQRTKVDCKALGFAGCNALEHGCAW
jgi:hypothetical protein